MFDNCFNFLRVKTGQGYNLNFCGLKDKVSLHKEL